MPPTAELTSDSDLEQVLEEFKSRQERRLSVGDSKYTCSISGCGESFRRLDQLDRHEYHHTGIKRHACSYEGCDKVYSIVTHLKRHLRSTHERTEPAAKTIKCSVVECDKLFTSSSNMLRHVRDNHECPREYPCSHCPKKFSQKLKLKRHEIREHTQDYPFRCAKCQRGFYQQWQQESHHKTCKLYTCPESGCKMEFDKWTIYIKHCRDTLHGRRKHKCQDCEQTYEKPSDLKRHREVKHSGGTAKSFTCPEPNCSRSYSYERNLRQHQLAAHTGRRFECQAVGCNRCFSSAQNLAKHLIRDHKEGTAKPTPEQTMIPPTKKSKNPRKRRRDCGQSKHSQLSKLSALPQLDKDTEEAIRQREIGVMEKVAQELSVEQLLQDTLDDL
ncbi:zinc finger protein 501 [Drosophila tropicalis]|uniref:zinc finger protein 501 n=1 Tax=Drosophila tropicalis TaxID=46794 RepID=UPI0035ABFA27